MNMLVSGGALLLAGGALFVYDMVSFREAIVRNMSIEAEIIGATSTSALLFNDSNSAGRTLSVLSGSPHITAAVIFGLDGRPFATYFRNPSTVEPVKPVFSGTETQTYSFGQNQIALARVIASEAKPVGTVYIESDLSDMHDRVVRYAEIVIGVMVMSLLAALLISSISRRSISAPIVHLADVASVVSRDKDYSVRAKSSEKHGELAVLIDAFNKMLERVQAHQEDAKRAHDELDHRVRERTAQLAAANKELESFSYSVSHDLRAPLRHIDGFSAMLVQKYETQLDATGQKYLQRIREGAKHMGQLVDDLLNMARLGRQDVVRRPTDTNLLVKNAISNLQAECEGRQIDWRVANLPEIDCDPGLMKIVFTNLLSNAVKYTRRTPQAVIEVGPAADDANVIVIRDNGAGFEQQYAHKLFAVFQRLHRAEDFEGTGVGLATVDRIIRKHGGRIWASGEVDRGATFCFTLSPAGELVTEMNHG
jgi:signal transduction histidine kinase